MLVGVDESGDFRKGSRGFFAVIFLRPSERQRVVAAHKRWEREVRKSLGLANEVKGGAIPDDWVHRFVSEVLENGSGTPVRYQAYAVDVDEKNLEAINYQRDLFVSEYRDEADRRDVDPRPDWQRAAGSWRRQAEWIGSMKPIPFLKLMTLAAILPTAVEWAVARSIAEQFDHELEHLAVLIDRGYVGGSDLASWREVLRNAFIGRTQVNPVPFSDEWDDTHPFVQKFVEGSRGDGVVLKQAFKEMIDFHDSTGTPEVRLADVVVGVVRRSELAAHSSSAYTALRQLALHTYSYRLLSHVAERRPFVNPYLKPGRGVD